MCVCGGVTLGARGAGGRGQETRGQLGRGRPLALPQLPPARLCGTPGERCVFLPLALAGPWSLVRRAPPALQNWGATGHARLQLTVPGVSGGQPGLFLCQAFSPYQAGGHCWDSPSGPRALGPCWFLCC